MKKIQKFLVAACAMLLLNSAIALEIIDVKNDYWAGKEIINAIQNGYIYVVDGNKFNPEGEMTRSDFVTALLKVIKREQEAVVQQSSFKDVSTLTPNKRNIVLSEQIRMAFGYPDKTFRPEVAINHNEAMSMIANITRMDYDQVADITSFEDYNKIPIWAKRAYVKNVTNNLYVNHPNRYFFTPVRQLTRAEAAVLFDKLSHNLDKVIDSYRDLYDQMDNGISFHKSQLIDGDDSLGTAPFAFNNKVRVYDNKIIVEAGNILIGTSLQQVKSRTDLVSNEYVFTAPNDLYTTKGRLVYPKGTEFYARVDKIGYSAWRSKPEATVLVFHKYSLPSGETYDMAAVPFTKDDNLVYVSDVKNTKKAKKLASYKMSQKEFAIARAHQFYPLVDYQIEQNKTIYVLLTGDMVIPLNETYFNLRTEKSLLDNI